MTDIKDTTFTQCVHGEPKCEKCKNIRVINWISVKDRMPETNGQYLIFKDDNTFSLEMFEDSSFPEIFVSKKNEIIQLFITHWADISRLKPE